MKQTLPLFVFMFLLFGSTRVVAQVSYEMRSTSSMLSSGTSSLVNQGFISGDQYIQENSLGGVLADEQMSSYQAAGRRNVPPSWEEPDAPTPIGGGWVLFVFAGVYAGIVYLLRRKRAQ